MIGGKTGSGNLYFRWRFSSGTRLEYVSISKKDVSGTKKAVAGWGIQPDQHREKFSSFFNVSIPKPNR